MTGDKREYQQKPTVVDAMNMIKKNHQIYLEKVMITHFQAVNPDVQNVDHIATSVDQIEQLQQDFDRQLETMLQDLTPATKIKNGVYATGVGLTTGLLVKYALDNTLPIPDFVPGKHLAVTGISLAIGSVMAKTFYDVWPGVQGQRTKPAMDSELFQKELEASGLLALSETLIKKFIKLFYYREFLLFGKSNDLTGDMFTLFKERYKKSKGNLSALEYSVAVESYFLKTLNNLFNDTFNIIYKDHDQKIQDDKNSYSVTRLFKRYFDNVNSEAHTQKLQVDFLKQFSGFLSNKIDEPTVAAQYPHLTASVAGLTAGAIALSGAAIIGVPITLGVAAIALVATAVTAITSYFSVSNIQAIKYTRSDKERQDLSNISQTLDQEAMRLKAQIDINIKTTDSDITDLDNYRKNHCDGLIRNAYILVGSSQSWLQEYAARYRHSRRIETDLGHNVIQPIAQTSQRQTADFVQHLTKDIDGKDLKTCVDTTKAYLNDTKNQDFIQKFHIKEKIKDQLLEIASQLPRDQQQPGWFIDFYVELGGVANDLTQVSILKATDLKTEASKINTAFAKVSKEDQVYILRGDNQFRDVLDLPADSNRLQLNRENIDKYLNSSFNFLFSLLERPVIPLNDDSSQLQEPIKHSNEFTIYHTLLLKQLVECIDPNNRTIGEETKSKIRIFLKERLLINPEILLTESFANKLLIGGTPSLDNLFDVVRHHIAYTSRLYTPQKMLAYAAGKHVENRDYLFALHQQGTNFRPEASQAYMQKITKSIEVTMDFVEKIKNDPMMTNTGALGVYLYEVRREIDLTLKLLNDQLALKTDQNTFLFKSKEKLHAFKESVDKVLSSQNMTFNDARYYELIDTLIGKTKVYVNKQRGYVYNNNNKIKIANKVLSNLHALKEAKITDHPLAKIFDCTDMMITEQDDKDLDDLKTQLDSEVLKKLGEIANHYVQLQGHPEQSSIKQEFAIDLTSAHAKDIIVKQSLMHHQSINTLLSEYDELSDNTNSLQKSPIAKKFYHTLLESSADVGQNNVYYDINGQVLFETYNNDNDTKLLCCIDSSGIQNQQSIIEKLSSSIDNAKWQQGYARHHAEMMLSDQRFSIIPIHKEMYFHCWRVINATLQNTSAETKEKLFKTIYNESYKVINQSLLSFLNNEREMSTAKLNQFIDKKREQFAFAMESQLCKALKKNNQLIPRDSEALREHLKIHTALDLDVIETNTVTGLLTHTHGVSQSSHSKKQSDPAIMKIEKYRISDIVSEKELNPVEVQYRCPSLQKKSIGETQSIEDQITEFAKRNKQTTAGKPIIYNLLTSIPLYYDQNNQEQSAKNIFQAMHRYNLTQDQPLKTDGNGSLFYVVNIPINQHSRRLKYDSVNSTAKEAMLMSDIAMLNTIAKDNISLPLLDSVNQCYRQFLQHTCKEALNAKQKAWFHQSTQGETAIKHIQALKDELYLAVENTHYHKHDGSQQLNLKNAFLKLYLNHFHRNVDQQKVHSSMIQAMFLALSDQNLKGCKSGNERFSYIENLNTLFKAYVVNDRPNVLAAKMDTILEGYLENRIDDHKFSVAIHRLNDQYNIYNSGVTPTLIDTGTPKCNTLAQKVNADLNVGGLNTNYFVANCYENFAQNHVSKVQAHSGHVAHRINGLLSNCGNYFSWLKDKVLHFFSSSSSSTQPDTNTIQHFHQMGNDSERSITQ
ncbi:hypothetical protein [Cysteiniphilum sp. 6C5]|uniref:hypothetical protein n=1 Tax=unclassified Cysteiniphilum TaxID=2610889 RepID=UPI003F831AA0